MGFFDFVGEKLKEVGEGVKVAGERAKGAEMIAQDMDTYQLVEVLGKTKNFSESSGYFNALKKRAMELEKYELRRLMTKLPAVAIQKLVPHLCLL